MPERVGGEMKGTLCVVLLCFGPAMRLSAQVPAESPQAPVARDTNRLVGPVGALWRSLVLPGWGQAATGRKVTGALFTIWEGTTMFMTLKAQQEVGYFKASGSPNLKSKRQEVQDWLVLWGFNHLFAGAEAFVAAHLRDFPKDLKIQAVPGGVGLRFDLP